MAGRGIQNSTRWFRFFLGFVVAFSGSLFFLMDDARSVQADESVQGESTVQGMDMDRHDHAEGTVDMMVPHQKHLGPHMKWTTLRTANADDTGRADQIVQTLRQALAKYKEYRVAMDDGYVSLHPERKAKHHHFANKQRRFQAKVHFEPAEPTALLYRKTGNGYELEGAMYTAPRGMSEDQLNERVPLSVAQWHAHVNLCLQPDGSRRRMTRKQLGGKGTIATESECQQAGGRFVPQAGGWMMHVYPFESTPAKIWTH
ncbi:MAG: hypothetical protein E8D41_09780 [Nitrospira sp.]|nr:MAG: hypothetical protein E8D41_09780 [Nitrospira sp.]